MNKYLKSRIDDGLAVLEIIKKKPVYHFLKELLEELKSDDEKCICCHKESALLTKENNPFCVKCYEKNIGI